MLGSDAPDFSLVASNGNNIRLSALKPNYVLLIFYPSNDSPTCNRQLTEVSMNGEELYRHGVRVFGVNTAGVERQKSYCERRQLSFPILSDPGGMVARTFGSRLWFFGVNRRTVVLVNPEGRICFYRRGKPSLDEILAAVTNTDASAPAA